MDLKDSLYNAVKGKDDVKNLAANPLVENGGKLIPSVTRVFSTDREFYVYLQAYHGGPVGTASIKEPPVMPLVAFVSFYRGREKF